MLPHALKQVDWANKTPVAGFLRKVSLGISRPLPFLLTIISFLPSHNATGSSHRESCLNRLSLFNTKLSTNTKVKPLGCLSQTGQFASVTFPYIVNFHRMFALQCFGVVPNKTNLIDFLISYKLNSTFLQVNYDVIIKRRYVEILMERFYDKICICKQV